MQGLSILTLIKLGNGVPQIAQHGIDWEQFHNRNLLDILKLKISASRGTFS